MSTTQTPVPLAEAPEASGTDPVPGGAMDGEAAAPPGSTPRSWTIEMPPGTPIVTGNNRLDRYERNRRIQVLKDKIAAIAWCRLKIPQLGPVEITTTYYSPPRLKRQRHPFASEAISDHDGIAPTSKALIDGLVACGVLRGDTKRWVRSGTCVLADETHPRGQVVLTITELTG